MSSMFELDLSTDSINEPESIYEYIVTLLIDVTVYVCGIWELLCLIFFVFHFIKKTDYYYTAYFLLLVIGYVVDLVSITSDTLTGFFPEVLLITHIDNFVYWYSFLFIGPWNTFLALNRFTAIIFWNKHGRIWSGAILALILAISLFYPFIVNGYKIFEGYCFWNFRSIKECPSALYNIDNFEKISTGINVALCAILGLITAFARKCKFIQISDDKKKFEKHLIIQCAITTFMFSLYCILDIIVNNVFDPENDGMEVDSSLTTIILYDLFEAVMKCYYLYFHMSSTLLLFILSKKVRQGFIDFYHLNIFFDCTTVVKKYRGSQPLTKSSKINVLTIISQRLK